MTGLGMILTPTRILVLSFAVLIALGAAVLRLPMMQAGAPVEALDCLFTSASAVCVTGLITVDTATAWSPWGQAVILLLIQLGGLGIMTFSVALLHLWGRRPSARSHQAMRGALGPVAGRDLGRMTRDVIVYTIVLETAGAVLLYWPFARAHAPAQAAALAAFHSVSAFCNAGFSLFSDSLMGYASDPVVNLVVMALILLGGIGFVVLRELAGRLPRRGRPRPPRLSLHARLVLASSGLLVVGGAVALAVLELVSDGGSAWGGTSWAALFMSVTPRTAGFNTIDLGLLSNASLLVIMGLMFIGASPGSCGGGVKTTTLAALAVMARTRLRGRPGAEVAGRSIPEAQLGQALTLVLVSLGIVSLAMVVLLAVGLQDHVIHQRGEFQMIMFEVFSALGTVGLSLGATPELTATGKVVVIGLMFLGRLGPLTLAFSLGHQLQVVRYRAAEERIILG